MIRILIVDDLLTIREILSQSLASISDFEIVGTASDAFSAIEKIESLKPDIILMDVEMPKLDGLNATQIITQQWKQVKVLILTACEREEYFERAIQVGAKGYLLKGIPTENLVEAIRNVVQGYFQLPSDLINKYLSKLIQQQTTFEEITELKQVIQTQLAQCKQLSHNSTKICHYIEQELRQEQQKMNTYLRENQKEQDWYASRDLAVIKKDLLALKRTFWRVLIVLLSLLSFSLSLGITIWLQRS
jgi:DNA-binding NarL/FixJ family response regulator